MSDRDHAVASAARCAPASRSRAALCVAELVGGWLTNSLALLSDAMHMFTDVGALGAHAVRALDRRSAGELAEDVRLLPRRDPRRARERRRPVRPRLVIVLIEAWRRLHDAARGRGRTGMLVIASLGLAVNVFVAVPSARAPARAASTCAARTCTSSPICSARSAPSSRASSSSRPAGRPPIALASIGIASSSCVGAWTLVREAVDVLMEACRRTSTSTQLQAALESGRRHRRGPRPARVDAHDGTIRALGATSWRVRAPGTTPSSTR